MDEASIAAGAEEVSRRRLARQAIAPIQGLRTAADGYAVQRRANALLAGRLGPVVGEKIGGTTAAMRAYLGLEAPVAGEIFASTLHANGTTLRLADFIRPGVETEIAVCLARPLPARAEAYHRDEVAAAVATVMAAIEIVDDRYEDFRCIGATLIADNAFDAGSVLGEPCPDPAGIELGALRARTLIDGRETASGMSDALLGHPLDALAWLANLRSAQGLGLQAGRFVSLGSITPVQWITQASTCRIEVEALGAVEIAFA